MYADNIVKFIETDISELDVSNINWEKLKSSKFNIITTSYAKPFYIEYQNKLLNKYFKENFSYTVFDCNFDLKDYSDILFKFCKDNGINYIKLHATPFNNKGSSSWRHGISLTWIYKHFIKLVNCPYFGFLDQDCFPIDNIDFLSKYLDNNHIYGYTFHGVEYIRDSAEIEKTGSNYKNHPSWTFCACVNFFQYDFVKHLNLNFMPISRDNYYIDTGGTNWEILYQYLDIKKYTNLIVIGRHIEEYGVHFSLIDCIPTDFLDLDKLREEPIMWNIIPKHKKERFKYYNGGGDFVYAENWLPKWLHVSQSCLQTKDLLEREELVKNFLDNLDIEKKKNFDIILNIDKDNPKDSLTKIYDKSPVFIAQIKSEFVELLDFLYIKNKNSSHLSRFSKYRYILDIGFFEGGTAFCFSHICHNLISVEINAPNKNLDFIKNNLKSYNYIIGNSNLEETLNKVKEILDGDEIDCLFIDGGHDYNTVSTDFQQYYPLVKKNGIIALHDIQPFKDQEGQYEVPIFWQELKNKFKNTKEIIHSDSTFGIGVIIKDE